MKRASFFGYVPAGAIMTLAVPFIFGYETAQVFGAWIGIALAVVSWILASLVMAGFWCFCAWKWPREKTSPAEKET